MTISEAARDLILEMEGLSSKPEWPGGQSGVTIGFGRRALRLNNRRAQALPLAKLKKAR